MNPVGDKKEEKYRGVSPVVEIRKKAERLEVPSRSIDTVKYIEKKLEEKGVQRMERHPADGIGIRQPPPKSGHGGKYTWEGPDGVVEDELKPAPVAIDEKDPNYVDEEEEKKILSDENDDVAGLVAGEVEVAKVAEDREGVARVEVDPRLKDN